MGFNDVNYDHRMPLMHQHHDRRSNETGNPISYHVVAPPFQNPISTTNRTRRRLSLCGACIVFVLALFLGTFLVIYPSLPSTQTLKFGVDSVTVKTFNISSNSYISSSWSFLFFATDLELCRLRRLCHHRDIHYQDLEVSVLYKKRTISSMLVNSDSFQNHKHGNKRLMHASIDVSPMHINPSIADEIKADWTSHRAVNFTVVVDALVEIEGEEDSQYRLRASCEQVEVGFSANINNNYYTVAAGTMLGASRVCNVPPLVDFKF